jgi:hypothetical protein
MTYFDDHLIWDILLLELFDQLIDFDGGHLKIIAFDFLKEQKSFLYWH